MCGLNVIGLERAYSIIIINIIIVLHIAFIWGIYSYKPETNHVYRIYM